MIKTITYTWLMVKIVQKFWLPCGSCLAVARDWTLELLRMLISGARACNYFHIWFVFFKIFQKIFQSWNIAHKISTDNFYKISQSSLNFFSKN